MASRAAQKEETRSRILQAARRHFEEYGFEATNIRALAAELGIASGTVFLHFPDKRDLLNGALFDDIAVTLEQAFASTGTGSLRAQLKRVTATFFEAYAKRPTLSRALLMEALLAEPPWSQRFAAQTAKAHASVVRLAEAARSRGELSPDADVALFAVAYLSFYYFGLLAWVQSAHPDPQGMVDHLVQQHLTGIAKPTAVPTRPPRKKKS